MDLVRRTGITGVSSAAADFPLHAAVLTEASVAESSNRLLLFQHFTVIVGAAFKMHSGRQLGTP